MFTIDNIIYIFLIFFINDFYLLSFSFIEIFGFLWFLSTVCYIISLVNWKRRKESWYYLYLKTAVYGTSWLVIIVVNLFVDSISKGGSL